MTNESSAPHCSHGNIILACPRDDCPEQNSYLAEHEKALNEHFERQREEARNALQEELKFYGLADVPQEHLTQEGEEPEWTI